MRNLAMATGKYLSLEEARKDGKIKRFCKEHPSKGDMDKFYYGYDEQPRIERTC